MDIPSPFREDTHFRQATYAPAPLALTDRAVIARGSRSPPESSAVTGSLDANRGRTVFVIGPEGLLHSPREEHLRRWPRRAQAQLARRVRVTCEIQSLKRQPPVTLRSKIIYLALPRLMHVVIRIRAIRQIAVMQLRPDMHVV